MPNKIQGCRLVKEDIMARTIFARHEEATTERLDWKAAVYAGLIAENLPDITGIIGIKKINRLQSAISI